MRERIDYLLTRSDGRGALCELPQSGYQARSWTKARRVVAKVEWHPGELYPRVGFIVTNLARPADNAVARNKHGTCELWIKEGKGAIKWTRLSCRLFAANAVSLQLHALADNLGNFLRTLAAPEPIKDWSLSSLKGKLMKIGAECPTNCASRLGIPNVASSKEQSLRHYCSGAPPVTHRPRSKGICDGQRATLR